MEAGNLRSFNLNTLPILREILRHGNLTKAAEALNLTQPSLSATLKQLRSQFNDELILRKGNKMELTPLGEKLIVPLENALFAVQEVITNEESDHGQDRPLYTVATNDHIMGIFGGRLAQYLADKQLPYIPYFKNAGNESLGELSEGKVDAIIAPRLAIMGGQLSQKQSQEIHTQELFHEDLVAIAGNEAAADAARSRDGYLESPHAAFTLARDPSISIEQLFMNSIGAKQNDVIRFSSYCEIVRTVAESDCIGLVPKRLAESLAGPFGLVSFDPPFAFPVIDWTLVWLQRNEDNNLFTDFRLTILDVARKLAAEGVE